MKKSKYHNEIKKKKLEQHWTSNSYHCFMENRNQIPLCKKCHQSLQDSPGSVVLKKSTGGMCSTLNLDSHQSKTTQAHSGVSISVIIPGGLEAGINSEILHGFGKGS